MKRLLALLVLFAAVPLARGHFIWIVPDLKDGPAAVIFSDSLKPDDPTLLAKIGKTQVFVRTADGKETAVKWTDAKDAYHVAPAKGPCVVGGTCAYGVLQRGDMPPFLLNYYATALSGCSLTDAPAGCCEPWDRMPLQVIPLKGASLRFQVLWQGKPLADAEVVALVPGKDKPVEAKSDAKGFVDVPHGSSGLYGIRARHIEKKKGTLDGKEYSESRHYATLVVQVPKGTGQKSADAPPPKEDPAASKLLQTARAARAKWTDFPGFTADIEVNFDGKTSKGTIHVDAGGKVRLEGIDKEMEPWARRTLASVVSHRLDDSSTRNTPCAFTDGNGKHPLGRAILVLNDELHSSYRIRDNQIMEVNRQMADGKFSISVLENRLNADGKYLSVSYAVNYWKLEGGELTRSEAHHQTWTRIGKFDLPVTTTVIASTRGEGKPAQSATLSNHRLQK